ncbi:hypothetical protein CIT26_02600 [Mesorhizobium temperatum]|uniref:Cytochrome c domain-containing protein n=2 Tax=Mesorhizobium temperatum TaxID=241416 RepID=A0A271LUZ2_9HYPH|nr:hypothetical protein CIT26_02600 [Mesorhizobium temperatum]
MHVDHLGASESSTGQIRTNSKLHRGQWGLREYRFDKESMRLLPTRTTGSPEPTLFSQNSPDSEATNDLVELVAESIRTEGSAHGPLLDPNINSFHLPGLPEHLLAAEMNAENRSLGDYAAVLHTEGNPDLIGTIKDAAEALAAEMNGQNDRLGADAEILHAEGNPDLSGNTDSPAEALELQIRKRIQSLSCAGCHQFSDRGRGGFKDDFRRPVCWQGTNNTHVTTTLRDGEYQISRALKFVFLPHREYVMRRYLAGNAPAKEDMSNDAQAAWVGLPHC